MIYDGWGLLKVVHLVAKYVFVASRALLRRKKRAIPLM